MRLWRMLRPATKRRFALLVLVIAQSGCALRRDIEIATKATEQFHQQMQAGQYDAIYDSASDEFKRTLAKPAALAYLTELTTKLGTCGNPKTSHVNISPASNGTLVSLDGWIECVNGPLEERFVWLIRQGNVQLNSYLARSPLL
jgi:hypothetical protein